MCLSAMWNAVRENGTPWQSAAINLIYSGVSGKKSGVIGKFHQNLLNHAKACEENSAESRTPTEGHYSSEKGWM